MFIHETARHFRTTFDGDVKLYRNVTVSDTKLDDGCSIGDDTAINRCVFGPRVIINRRSYINDSILRGYTYTGINATIQWAKIGRFCSLSRNVDIGGSDHDYRKMTMLPEIRFNQMLTGEGVNLKSVSQKKTLCEIGNDVWIGSGAIVLHKAKIGDGAVIGAGAVVTGDVPPYAIVAGVPATIMGFRCSKENIERLLRLKWWDLEDNILAKVGSYLIKTEISPEAIEQFEEEVDKLREKTGTNRGN